MCLLAVAFSSVELKAQTDARLSSSNHPAAQANSTNNPAPPSVVAPIERIQNIRRECIAERRRICGRVVQVLPDGLVVDSGYLTLLRPEFSRSWLIQGNVTAEKSENYVEGKTPGAVCKGLVFLSDVPRRPTVKPYDYVVLFGYPCGVKTYTSVGTVKRTVRKFSAVLVKAVDAQLQGGAAGASVK